MYSVSGGGMMIQCPFCNKSIFQYEKECPHCQKDISKSPQVMSEMSVSTIYGIPAINPWQESITSQEREAHVEEFPQDDYEIDGCGAYSKQGIIFQDSLFRIVLVHQKGKAFQLMHPNPKRTYHCPVSISLEELETADLNVDTKGSFFCQLSQQESSKTRIVVGTQHHSGLENDLLFQKEMWSPTPTLYRSLMRQLFVCVQAQRNQWNDDLLYFGRVRRREGEPIWGLLRRSQGC